MRDCREKGARMQDQGPLSQTVQDRVAKLLVFHNNLWYAKVELTQDLLVPLDQVVWHPPKSNPVVL